MTSSVTDGAGILNIIVFVAVAAVFILMGTVIILRILVKRRKYADAIIPDRTIPQEKPHFCPACGKRVGSTAAFCAYCGAKISGSMPHRPGL